MSKVLTVEIVLAIAMIVAVAMIPPPRRADQVEVRWRGEPVFIQNTSASH